jgi:hypothetical protein
MTLHRVKSLQTGAHKHPTVAEPATVDRTNISAALQSFLVQHRQSWFVQMAK